MLVEILSGELLEKHSDGPTNVVGRTTTTRSVFSSVIKGCVGGVGVQGCCAGVVGRTVFRRGLETNGISRRNSRTSYEQVGRRATTMRIKFFFKTSIV